MLSNDRIPQPENVRLSDDGSCVIILDQSRLPNHTEYKKLSAAEDMYTAIKELQVRGAPAIGICAAYGLYCLARTIEAEDTADFLIKLHEYAEYLNSARPTAVNLSWALKRMEKTASDNSDRRPNEIVKLLHDEASEIQTEDIEMCRSISEYGLSLLHEEDCILTHCNAGPLATSCYGTAIGPILLGRERGMKLHVFADETRPLLQGARLTSYELSRAGVDVTLICDNMAGLVMKNGWIDVCFVGCDRVAANGDTANKIGTSVVAVLAHYYGIPFYVLGPTSSIDMTCRTGDDIRIELREGAEISRKYYTEPMALPEVKCYNPSFDITDNTLISGIITERGIIRPPYTDTLKKLFKERGENE